MVYLKALQPLQFSRQIGVFLSESTRVVGREGDSDFIPADIDVRVVEGFFGKDGYLGDESHGGDEVFEFKCARDGFSVAFPAGQLAQGLCDLCFIECVHDFYSFF